MIYLYIHTTISTANIYWMFSACQVACCFSCIISHKSHSNPMKEALSWFPIYRWGVKAYLLNNLSKQPAAHRVGIQTKNYLAPKSFLWVPYNTDYTGNLTLLENHMDRYTLRINSDLQQGRLRKVFIPFCLWLNSFARCMNCFFIIGNNIKNFNWKKGGRL